jgi:hypothetical protein
MLPADAWSVVSMWGSVGALTRGPALVLRDGEGAAVHADQRGRVTLPVAAFGVRAGDAAVIVAVRRPPAGDVAVIAPMNVLDALVDDLVGEVA